MGVPVIIVEVRSKGQADDHNRMLVQGASLVQLANGILVKKGKKPDFVLVAIYFDYNGIFRRYLIYQDEARVCGHVICMVPIAERTRRTRYCVWRKHSLTSWKTGFGWFTKCTIWFHNRKWLKGSKWSRRSWYWSQRQTVPWKLSQQQRRQGDDRETGEMGQEMGQEIRQDRRGERERGQSKVNKVLERPLWRWMDIHV